ncbi:cell surface protein [Methanosarcina siciliae C2J]|uniref:Cell surface protein n=1 Tax=Methanosarcina siciliae C2J TaxID=1434118 RepID=A0A0E3LDF2_9EURY|nr:PKD domain-containing protein [Methanosarcina siciliae]AKB37166.1 cell surface protein [Methanosarcina siciliae C2J]
MSCAICLTLLAGSAAAAEVHFALVDPKEASSDFYYEELMKSPHNNTTDVVWITGSGETLLDAWNDAATKNGYTYEMSGNPSYPNQLSTINGPFTNYEGWGNNGSGFVWWKTYVCDGSNLSTWDNSLSQTGVVLADHSASEYPYFAFVWGCWATWPYPDGISGSPYTVLPSDCPLAPVANFTSDVTSGPAPLAVQFNDISTGSPTSWQWDFDNDGNVDSEEQSPSFTYDSAGTYTVNLTVSNAGGSDSEVKTDYISVSESLPSSPVSNFTATPTSGDAPLTVQFTDASTGTVSSYAWDFDNDGTVDSEEQSPSYTYDSAGSYSVNLTVSNAAGNDSELKTEYIVVEPVVIVEPSEVKFVLVDPANGTSEWINGSGTNLSDAWDNAATNNGYTYAIGGNPAYPGQLSTINGPFTGYEGWGNNGTGMTWWKTYVSDGSNLSTWNIDYSQTGIVLADHQASEFPYFAFVWGQWTTWPNPWGMGTDFTVLPSDCPVAPVANFTSDVTSGPAPLAVQFNDSSAGSPTSWQWDFDNDGTVDSTEQNPIYTYESVGTYTVNLTVSNAVGSDSEVKTEYITVEPGDAVKFLIDCQNGTTQWVKGGQSGDTILQAWDEAATYYGIQYTLYTNNNIESINGMVPGQSWWQVYVNDGTNLNTWTMKYTYDLTGHISSEHPYIAFTYGGNWQGNPPSVYPSSCPFDVPVANFAANVTSGTAPLVVQFNDTSTGNVTSWQWDFNNDGTVDSTEQNPIYTYSTAGTYDVNLTVSNAVGSDSEVKTEYISILLPSAPVANFTAAPTYGSAPLTVQFTDVSSGNVSSYAWDLDNDGVVDNTTRNPLYTYSAAGIYTVNLTVIGPDGSGSEVKTDYIVVNGGTSGLAQTPWPKFQMDSYNTGQSQYAGPETNNIIWTYTAGAAFQYCSPAIGADGTIYIGNKDKKVYALNPDGTQKWNYTTVSEVVCSPSIAPDGTIYVGSTGTFYAINPDGTLKWNYTTGGTDDDEDSINVGSAIGSDGTIYFGCSDHKLYALNPDGTLKWNYTTGSYILDCPAIGADGTIYIGSSFDKNVYALNPDGTLKWKYYTGGVIYGSPAIGVDGTIYIGSTSKYLYALKPDGTLKWKYSTGLAGISASAAIGSDRTIYVGAGGTLYALNPDGTLKWSNELGYDINRNAPAIGVDGTIYVGESELHYIYALNPDGTTKWRYTAGDRVWCTPAIGSDGTLYIGSKDNKLYAFKDIAAVPPVADFAADITGGNAPLTVNFTDASNGTVSSWAWDFENDGVVDSTEQNPSHTYASAGNYTVNLTVANANGADSELKTDYITVSSIPVEPEPVAAFTADVTDGTAPLTVNFTDQSTGTPTSWLWDFGDGANSTEQNPSHTYSAAGNYTVNLTVENAAGTDFELKSDYIEVSEASGSTVTLYFDPESSSVAENESTEISIVASNFPAGLSGYNLTVAIDDPAVAEIVNIEYPSWALITENSTLPATSIYMKTVDLEDAVKEGAADVVLATLTVSGKEKGSANLSIGVKRLEEDSGDSIEPALLAGTIEVTLLSPLPDQEYAPKDLDGDGLYEDLTGNGEFSFVDIVAYFHNMDWIEENMPVEYFDFNGNGRIDFDDVVDMFAMI